MPYLIQTRMIYKRRAKHESIFLWQNINIFELRIATKLRQMLEGPAKRDYISNLNKLKYASRRRFGLKAERTL
jgi:hypothetical protein